MIRAFNKKTRLIVFLFMILCIEQQSIKFIVLPIMYFGLFSLGLSTGCFELQSFADLCARIIMFSLYNICKRFCKVLSKFTVSLMTALIIARTTFRNSVLTDFWIGMDEH